MERPEWEATMESRGRQEYGMPVGHENSLLRPHLGRQRKENPFQGQRLSKVQCKYNTTLGNLSFQAGEESRKEPTAG